MKTKNISILFLLLCLVYSCATETAEVIPPDPAIDTWQLAKEYIQDLNANEDGWIVKYQPSKESDIYTIYMKFTSGNTVSILSNYPDLKYLEEQTSVNYSLTGALNMELVFNTYCVWHKMYDDFGGDYKFIINRQDDGNFTMQSGNEAKTQSYDLVKATPEAISELAVSIEQQKEIVETQNKAKWIRNMLYYFMEDPSGYFKNIILKKGNTDLLQGAIRFDMDHSRLQISFRDSDDRLVTRTENYRITEQGIALEKPVSLPGNTISEFLLEKKEGSNDITIISAGAEISGEMVTAKQPGVVPYPDIVSHYLAQDMDCGLYKCTGEALVTAYNKIMSPTVQNFIIFFDHSNNYYGWHIIDEKYFTETSANDLWLWVTPSTLNTYTVKHTYWTATPENRYPDDLLNLYCQEQGYIILYKKKKYNDNDAGSIVLMDPNNNENQLVLRVSKKTWDVDWDNVAYAE